MLRFLLLLALVFPHSKLSLAQQPVIRGVDQSITNSDNVDVRDFDLDGDPDLFIENAEKFRLEIIENLGNGQYAPPRTIYRFPTLNQRSMVADVNGDLLPDIIVGGSNHNRIAVLHNYRNFNFEQATLLELDNNVTMDFYTSDPDIDGDGYDDFLCKIDGQTNIARGSSSGLQSFEIIPLEPEQTSQTYIGAADINGDGLQDLLLPMNDGSTSIHVVLQTEGFNFLPGISTNAYWTINSTTQMADLTGDGILDLVYNNGGLFLLPGLGDGTFDESITVFSSTVSKCRIGDFNNDGYMDLTFPYYPFGCTFPSVCNGQIYIFWNQGDSTFEPDLYSSFHSSITNLFVSDLTEDGLDDVIVISKHQGINLVASVPGNAVADPVPLASLVHEPLQVSSVDVDQDGLEDLVVADTGVFGSNYSHRFGGLGWYRNLGNGNYSQIVTLTTDLEYVSNFTWCDFDDDGDLDFFFNDDDSLYFLENNDGAYIQTVIWDSPFNHLLVLDSNYDGQLEVFGFYTSESNGRIFQLNGNTWNTSILPLTKGMRFPQIVDIDADQNPDIVFYSSTYDGFFALKTQVDDLPFVTTIRNGITAQPQALSIIDLDLDGNLDILAVDNYNLVWYSNPGSFPFLEAQPEVSLGISSSLYPFNSLTTADFDGNGLDDVVYSANDELVFCYRDWFGDVQHEIYPRYDFINERLSTCKTTENGLPDLLIVGQSNSAIEVRINSSTITGCSDEDACNYVPDVEIDSFTCIYSSPFDLDCSGSFDAADIISFLNSYGCTEECGPADFNQDGMVNVVDLLYFITANVSFFL